VGDCAADCTVRGSNLGIGRRFFHPQNVQTGCRGLPSLVFNVYRGCFAGVKRPERDVDNSSPFNAKVKNRCPSTCFGGVDRETLHIFLSCANLHRLNCKLSCTVPACSEAVRARMPFTSTVQSIPRQTLFFCCAWN
jgi:hypothetical protein